jgi:hypothetical protein
MSLWLIVAAKDVDEAFADLHSRPTRRDDVRRIVSRRKAEHAWVRANPGPMTYGPEPGKALWIVADAASGSGPFGLHSTQVRPNKSHVTQLPGIAKSRALTGPKIAAT